MAEHETAARRQPDGGLEDRHACWLDALENTKPQPETQPIRAAGGTRDRQFRVAGDWALATDGLQWIVQRRRQKAGRAAWQPVSFVCSTGDVLRRCLRVIRRANLTP